MKYKNKMIGGTSHMKKIENAKETMELIYFPEMEMLESSNSMFMIEDKDGP